MYLLNIKYFILISILKVHAKKGTFDRQWRQTSNLNENYDYTDGKNIQNSDQYPNQSTATNFSIDFKNVFPQSGTNSAKIDSSYQKSLQFNQKIELDDNVISSDVVLGYTPKLIENVRNKGKINAPIDPTGYNNRDDRNVIYSNDVLISNTKSKSRYDSKLNNYFPNTTQSRYKIRTLNKHNARHGSKRKSSTVENDLSRNLLNNTVIFMNINDTRLDQLFVGANTSVEYEPATGPTPEIDRLEDYRRFREEVNDTRGTQTGTENRRLYFDILKNRHKKLPIAYSHSSEEKNYDDDKNQSRYIPNQIERRPKSCYTCDETTGEQCYNLPTTNGTIDIADSIGVTSQLCEYGENFCMVSRVWFVTKTSEVNKTEHQFSIQRGCAKECKPYCIMMGDRREVEIFTCKSCCSTSDCNIGSHANIVCVSTLLPSLLLIQLQIRRILRY